MNLNLRYQFPGNSNWPFFLMAIALIFFFSSIVKAQPVYPTGFSQVLVANTISDPTALAFAPSTDGRIFVTQQSGKLRIIKNGALLTNPAADLTVNAEGERGLLGVALDPDFTTNHYIYLYYTVVATPFYNKISRFTLDGDTVLEGSESPVLSIDPLGSATNHNGGAMAFGPDGKLYVGIGENATGANAQNLDTHLGKLLRINADGSVPSGNPYPTGSEQKKRIWAYGLRNPYTFEFQPGTGKLFINDVGQGTWEEINDATSSGLNFGWPSAEGASPTAGYTNPFYSYAHGDGDGVGCAITGGTFFNPTTTNYPSEYTGKYFFLDLCEKWINYIDPTASTPSRSAFATAISGSPLALQTGRDGNLYYLSRDDNALYKIVSSNVTAVKPNQANSGSSVYPQPASEWMNVEMTTAFSSYSVSFTDPLGKTFYAPFSTESGKLQINVSTLPAGVYALKVADASKTITQQVTVVK